MGRHGARSERRRLTLARKCLSVCGVAPGDRRTGHRGTQVIDSTRAFAKLVAAFNQNDWPRVQQRTTQLLALAPGDTRLLFMGGVAAMQVGSLGNALSLLKEATHLEPRRADYLAQYAKALALARRTRDARLVADRAMTLAPDDALTFDTLGAVYAQAQALVQAASAFRRVTTLQPNRPLAHYNLARALIALGDIDGAEHELETCVRLAPDEWNAWLALARVRTQTAAHNRIAALQGRLAANVSEPAAQILLNMALGKAFEDLADYPRAFDHYARGKAAARRQRSYAFARDKAMFEAIVRACPVGAVPADSQADGPSPIFLVGMPCSGIGLAGRILAAHPDLRSIGTLPHFPLQLQRAAGGQRPLLVEPDIARRIAHIDWAHLGRDYLARVHAATGETTRHIDKLPSNLLYVGFISRALPHAKFIYLRRNALDTCLDNFRHLFDLEPRWHDYSFDLLDTGRYLIETEQLLAHWQRCLPGRILEIPYESLQTGSEAATRQLLAFCDLPWHPACLTPRPAPQPDALSPPGHWRHYEAQLRDLRQLMAGHEGRQPIAAA